MASGWEFHHEKPSSTRCNRWGKQWLKLWLNNHLLSHWLPSVLRFSDLINLFLTAIIPKMYSNTPSTSLRLLNLKQLVPHQFIKNNILILPSSNHGEFAEWLFCLNFKAKGIGMQLLQTCINHAIDEKPMSSGVTLEPMPQNSTKKPDLRLLVRIPK